MSQEVIFPRQDFFDLLHKRLADFSQGYRQNVALLGDELIGKSTFLRQFLSQITAERIVPVYVEVPPGDFSFFVHRLLASLMYQYLNRSGQAVAREEMDILMQRFGQRCPRSATSFKSILGRLDRDKVEVLFRELWQALDIFEQESECSCVLVFDEFHHLKRYDARSICQELGKWIMFQKKTWFVFASSLKSEAKSILVDDLSLLFGNFETVELPLLDFRQCEELITNALGPVEMPRHLLSFLIHFTGGHPFYLSHISVSLACQAALRGCQDVKQEMLVDVLEQLLFQTWGLFSMRFEMVLAQLSGGRYKSEMVSLLTAVACGKNRVRDLSLFLRRSSTEIQQRIARLCEQGVVVKNGSFYTVTDRVMAFWLKFVYREKLGGCCFDPVDHRESFVQSLTVEVETFLASERRDVADRLLELFNLFDGDELAFDQKKFPLPPFKELKLLTMDNSSLKVAIFGKSQDSGMWLAAINERGLSESDVIDLVGISKTFKNKSLHKILISLGEVDRNARLLAKESQVTTLDLRSLNTLLDIYGQPRIVR